MQPLKYLLYLLGKVSASFKPVIQLFAAAVIAEPAVIEIGYGETVNFQVGMMNFNTGTFTAESFLFLEARTLNFKAVEYPGNSDQESWYVDFDPFLVDLQSGALPATNASISLRTPPINENAIQSGILKINITDTWSYGDLYWPSFRPTFGGKLVWLSYALFMGFGKYSGHTLPEYHEVEILVKIKPYHSAELDAVKLVELRPNDLVSIPVSITNIGNYKDTINFRVVSKNEDIRISNPVSITLAPGEKNDTYLGVAIPQSFFDTGTLHEIKIEAYSIDDPNVTIAERTVIVETRGINVDEGNGSVFGFLFFLLILGVAFVYYRRKKMHNQICVKPDKPWKIAEEEAYLEKLKSEDKDKYNETLKMMQDEYQSSLLWYRNYCNSVLNQKYKKKIPKGKKLKPVEKSTKTKKEGATKLKEAQPEKPIIKEKEPIIKKTTFLEDKEKQRAIKRIKQQQEKQKRKFKNLGG